MSGAEHISETEDTIVEDSPEKSVSQRTLELLEGLTKRMEVLEDAHKKTTKRTRRQHDASSDEEDLEDEEQKDKKLKTFEVSSPTKEFLSSAFSRSKPLENATRQKL